ncbi:MAG: dihydrofolate reductase [Pararhodobacter sp.]|nr:dihydrofolate reductase [Pararhodobacter sp.]
MSFGKVFIAASLDGFIARADGAIDWLLPFNAEGEDHGYDAFIAGVDGLVMGRATYETVLGFGDWPYAKPVVVMSRTLGAADVPQHLRQRVRITADAPADIVHALRAEGWRSAYVDGGEVIRSFLAEGLIGRITLTLVPILLGRGRPLFGAIGREVRLEREAVRPFRNGLVSLDYRVEHSEKAAGLAETKGN